MDLIVSSQVNTMTSREMADLTEKRHDNVKRTIEVLVEKGIISQPQIEDGFKSANGIVEQRYLVSKRDSYVIVAQLSPEFTARLVDRWQQLEAVESKFEIPKTYAQAMRLAADQSEKIDFQKEQLSIAAPKIAFVENYVQLRGLKGFREIAKLLKINEARFREFMTVKKIMYRLGGDWVSYQSHIDAGRFEVKTGISELNNHAFSRTFFTTKGVEWIAGIWAIHILNSNVNHHDGFHNLVDM